LLAVIWAQQELQGRVWDDCGIERSKEREASDVAANHGEVFHAGNSLEPGCVHVESSHGTEPTSSQRHGNPAGPGA
jgi:hypothetical protein